mmetsp:Transcript_73029/g.171672  ORF Transcript_73029/g.171672 Transcript_73029/m.171672 type:complete len:138 (-) Transcript_73029:53-466(-)|eukprot:CAMPEP_0175918738 /NCGR_PEP_ID=MMETSP0108-20121206/12036_1 /TAXON_ID=195067 ORGANISM="Goniomonas pacifica, Strain CCMP1869" /NCGR_SAMPLE_ID=MMETSP0108 /ASSEMBLY_ACC=CAM_ASM_000204 /LENGTH=137 /DNA_ID=CAMNT_0017241369 /DNA_START=9 /DNA_END=422 /DNA_ORIENTATION=-
MASFVQGLGGVFLHARDAKALSQWYSTTFNLKLDSWGPSVFGLKWPAVDVDRDCPARQSSMTFAIFQAENPSSLGSSSASINLRVSDLDAVLAQLKEQSIELLPSHTSDGTFGRFRSVQDPEGNRVEIWEPPLLSKD